LIFTLVLVTISHASFFQLKVAIWADASDGIVGNFDPSWSLGCCSYISKNWGLLTPSFLRLGAHLLLKFYGVKFDEESGRNIASFNPAVMSSATPLNMVLVVSRLVIVRSAS
jgi:hypothetical protein